MELTGLRAGRGLRVSGTLPPMYERTELPDGPRVISARVPGARSLALRRLRARRLTPRDARARGRSRTSWSTSPSRGRPRTPRRAPSPRRSRRSAARATPRPIASRPSTGRASPSARPTAPFASSANWWRGRSSIRARSSTRRDVIVEEIRSYVDDPAEYSGILFDRAMFGEGPLGREIAGDEATVRGLTPEAIRGFWRDCYGPARMVVAASGDMAHEAIVARVAEAFGTGGPATRTPSRHRRSPPATASSWSRGTRPRPRCAWASRRCVATTRTSGSSTCSTRSSGRG